MRIASMPWCVAYLQVALRCRRAGNGTKQRLRDLVDALIDNEVAY